MEVGVDFLAVGEHRLIPARVRGEWSRLRKKGLASVSAPASQDSSHVGNAGVGVVSLRFASLFLPTFATAQFRRFFDCGRAVRCLLPLGAGRFMHLVVLHGFQGADVDADQLALTEQLFDAAFGELSVVQPCLVSAGLWVDLESAWALAAGLQPAPTCKRDLNAACGHRRVVLLLLLRGWLLILLLGLFLSGVGGPVELLSLCSVPPFGLPLGCLLLIKVGAPSRLRFRGFGRFMMGVSN